MSTPEHPASPPLTRKQLREIRNTGATPVIPDGTADAADIPSAPPATPAPPTPVEQSTPIAPPPAIVPPPAPLPRAAEPTIVSERPIADSAVDLGVSPLTRRQARQQERIRTASVPVITPEVAAAASSPATSPFAPAGPVNAESESPAPRPAEDADPFAALFAPGPVATAPVATAVATEQTAAATPEVRAAVATEEAAVDRSALEETAGIFGLATPTESSRATPEQAPTRERVVNPLLGASLLTSDPAEAAVPNSFDQLISESSGSASAPSALIISQAPAMSPIVAPVTSTGELLITGTLNLPEGLGSTGHAPGTADGKEVDAVLVDGELPAHSSPTPIAASAAVSTSKTAGEVIQPPTPEKGGRLMMSLAITAGVLALALVGVLILAFATGVFS
ncbi:hypothetical protein [Microbacterium hominis]|uniref:Uncharacterized protein n=1 Tax=Microbacterium hominis TaxID=162426 RepID=A0A7D4UI65_9MICO|nr:hypothetical protein [Microbacterium hominis]QKJ19368.1 hypothetical protein HQM25_08300 [Microbacterium hominis]